MKFIPHRYQEFAIDFIVKNTVAALLLDMGLGWQNGNNPHLQIDV